MFRFKLVTNYEKGSRQTSDEIFARCIKKSRQSGEASVQKYARIAADLEASSLADPEERRGAFLLR